MDSFIHFVQGAFEWALKHSGGALSTIFDALVLPLGTLGASGAAVAIICVFALYRSIGSTSKFVVSARMFSALLGIGSTAVAANGYYDHQRITAEAQRIVEGTWGLTAAGGCGSWGQLKIVVVKYGTVLRVWGDKGDTPSDEQIKEINGDTIVAEKDGSRVSYTRSGNGLHWTSSTPGTTYIATQGQPPTRDFVRCTV